MKTTSRVCLLCSLILSALAAVGAESPLNDAFIKTVSALPAEQQVGAVIAKLKELNPNFDGKETHKISGGVVTELTFSTVGVTDISPVKALSWLRTLYITPPALNQKGSLADLSPLQGMQLMWLWCFNNPIIDLSPLKGMPLTGLSFGGTRVSDLSPLTGMKLQVLSFNDTVVSELGPLEGMPLTVLWCHNTKVTDLTPLKAMPLGEIKCDFVAERDAAVLRGIKTLRKINDLPAATFWMRVGPVAAATAPRAPVQGTGPRTTPPTASTMQPHTGDSVSAKEQIRRFVEGMKALNPSWDGAIQKCDTEGNKVVFLAISAYGVTNLAPIRVFTKLRGFECTGTTGGPRAELTDLAPLKGLKLQHFKCELTRVNDISCVEGMPMELLHCGFTEIVDASPIASLRSLESLQLHVTKVTDLSPLKGLHIRKLHIGTTAIRDLSPLRGMPLVELVVNGTKVEDLSPIESKSLKMIRCDFVPERDTKILRAMKQLETINKLSAAQFWKRVEAGESPQVK